MRKRLRLFIAALVLVVSPAVVTPSHAGSVVTVSEGFTVENSNYSPTIESITFNFTGLNGLTGVSFVGAVNTNPLGPVTTLVTSSASTESVTISFAPSAFSAAGTLSFTTGTSATTLPQLQSEIQLTGTSVQMGLGGSSGFNTQEFGGLFFNSLAAVPEPSSMALLGIGMTGFLAFRRFFKRSAVV